MFFNSVLQLIFSIFRNNSYTSPFNSSTEGTLLKCMLQTAHNACNSKDVDALKFQLVRHDIFYNGQNQQDSTECLLMLINIIDKGSMPDSSSTTSPMGASLSDLLFSFVLEKYIVCEVCGLRSPSFESSSVLHISPTDTPSKQNLILEGLQQKLQKSCSRCNKNTQHMESSYILQPPKYLLLFVNRFTLIIISSKIDAPYLWIRPLCLVPWNLTCRLLLIIMDHLLISVITPHLSIVAEKHSIATITKLRSLDLLIKTPLLHILYYINGLTHDFWTRTGGWEFDRSHGAGTSSPSHRQQVEEQAPKPVGWKICFLLMTLVPVQKLCVNIYVYIYVYITYTSSVTGRIYNGSVIQYWRRCTPSHSIGECAVPGLNAILCFLWFTNCVLLFDNNLILGCLWH